MRMERVRNQATMTCERRASGRSNFSRSVLPAKADFVGFEKFLKLVYLHTNIVPNVSQSCGMVIGTLPPVSVASRVQHNGLFFVTRRDPDAHSILNALRMSVHIRDL